jgi:glycerol-3-phosphate acyltransferase PlsY
MSSEVVSAILLLLASYLLGSLSPSVFLGRLIKGVDVREHGSGNPGTTNAFRVLGVWLGIVVLICDVAKGFMPVLAARLLGVDSWVLIAAAVAAMVGHNYSVFLRGRGGKGIATAAGAIIAMMPVISALLLAGFAVVLLATSTVSAASIFVSLLFPTLTLTMGQPLAYVIFSLAAASITLYAHRGNMRRLWRREEPRIKLPWTRIRRARGGEKRDPAQSVRKGEDGRE